MMRHEGGVHPARADGGVDYIRADLSTLLKVAPSLSKGEADAR